ncbi:MAG: glycosyltransferase family 1 protein [Candidatus Scalindua sp. AMX11]|nr:MAG: glycosyltransferase family 1 protein [Candidatus Scalindua sp.]NOG82712.1 glycosyltransferase [Planctomycetota bacterium]RZV95353.1 MAG: glycosyltransferase family 1 protein [Candidatus Scalindua sp. SCAELEC01]TDE66316.1 MAG: glycosyltransferase family 1 protein [Candidatus Scalindua sp. AMX11]
MNVLQFICPTGLYGAERWILALAKFLNSDYINCQLAVTKESKDQNIEIFERFKFLGLDSHQIQAHGRFDLFMVSKLVTLIRQKSIDIIHTHGYKSDILGVVAAYITGIRSVATPHGFENVRDRKLQIYIKLGGIALRYFDRVVPLSEDLEYEMYKIGINPKKVRLIQNGVDLEEIERERSSHIPSLSANRDEKIIGYIGQMASRKNILDLIKTFDLLYAKHKNIKLLLVGDGPQRDELEKQAKEMDSSSKIHFLGYQNDRLRILKEFDLFCMTSSLEGIPRSVMEAMAMGIPVAAFDIPGIDKLIVDGKTGLVADFGNREKLKECCERLIFNEELSYTISQNGRDHILNHFSSERMAQGYTSLYYQLLDMDNTIMKTSSDIAVNSALT